MVATRSKTKKCADEGKNYRRPYTRKDGTSVSETCVTKPWGLRKTRSDKGVKRGPRKSVNTTPLKPAKISSRTRSKTSTVASRTRSKTNPKKTQYEF